MISLISTAKSLSFMSTYRNLYYILGFWFGGHTPCAQCLLLGLCSRFTLDKTWGLIWHVGIWILFSCMQAKSYCIITLTRIAQGQGLLDTYIVLPLKRTQICYLSIPSLKLLSRWLCLLLPLSKYYIYLM